MAKGPQTSGAFVTNHNNLVGSQIYSNSITYPLRKRPINRAEQLYWGWLEASRLHVLRSAGPGASTDTRADVNPYVLAEYEGVIDILLSEATAVLT